MEKRINIFVNEEQLEKTEQICTETGMSKSEVFRKALEVYYKKYEQEKREYMNRDVEAKKSWMEIIKEDVINSMTYGQNVLEVAQKGGYRGGFIISTIGDKNPTFGKYLDFSGDKALILYPHGATSESKKIKIRWSFVSKIGFDYFKTEAFDR